MEPYISLTVYYTDDFEMQSQCLQMSFYPQDQTEVNCLGTEGSNDLYGLQKMMGQMLRRHFL